MEYSHSLLRPFYTKLVWVPDSRELREPEPRVSVPGNPEPILTLCKKAVKGYGNIPLCIRNAYKWIVKWIPSSRERNPREPRTLTPLNKSARILKPGVRKMGSYKRELIRVSRNRESTVDFGLPSSYEQETHQSSGLAGIELETDTPNSRPERI